MTARTQPEALVRKAVRKHLELGGWRVFPIVQSALSHRGLSDLFAMREGVVVFVECKTATGRLSDAQETFGATCAECGVSYVVARSTADVDCLVDVLAYADEVTV